MSDEITSYFVLLSPLLGEREEKINQSAEEPFPGLLHPQRVKYIFDMSTN